MHLTLSPTTLAVCRLPEGADAPIDPCEMPFFSLTRTSEELSIVLPEDHIRHGWRVEAGWRMFQVAGPLDFALTGVVAGLTAPLAAAGIPVFVISTFDTDYLLVKAERLKETLHVLRDAGHSVSTPA